MNITVSISEFRNKISSYLSKAQEGNTIILKDEKRGDEVAEVIGKKKFDPIAFGKALDKAAGIFTVKNHPEWRTKKQVISWVRKSRAEAERSF